MAKPVTMQDVQSLLSRGRNAEAVEAYREFLRREPGHLAAWNGLALLLRRLGRVEESEAAIAEAARAEAAKYEDPAAVQRFLAAAGRAGKTPATAPATFVTKLFDDAAERFETLLKHDLAYRGPELLLEAVTRVHGESPRDLDVLDLGCGTGLAGEVFRAAARRLDGVDLSSKMLERAAAKRVYESLAQADVVEHLVRTSERYDLILAADVFIYVGGLAPVFAAARRVLRPDGLLAFTAEVMDSEGDDLQLQAVRRYAHSRGYLARTAAEAGFAIPLLEVAALRTESTRPVRAWIAVMHA
ncbi:MAG: methyltransferase domain-containing protein [Gemmataceae bacterium]